MRLLEQHHVGAHGDSTHGPSRAQTTPHEHYRAFGLLTTPLPDRRTLIFNRITGRTHLLSRHHNEVLQFCSTPRSIDGHAIAYLRRRIATDIAALRKRKRFSFRAMMLSWLSQGLAGPDQPKKVQRKLLASISPVLDKFASDGLLLADSDILAKLTDDMQSTPRLPLQLSTVAVPTRERVGSLRRTLRSIDRKSVV